MAASELRPAGQWAQQPGEPSLWFHRYSAFYLPQSPTSSRGRSVDEAYRRWRAREGTERHAREAPGLWHARARQWAWRTRASALDENLRVQHMAEERAAISAMYREVAEQAVQLRAAAYAQFRDRFVERHDGPAETLSASALISLFVKAVAIERQARGVSPEVMELVIRLSSMSDEELLDQYEAHVRRGEGDAARQRPP